MWGLGPVDPDGFDFAAAAQPTSAACTDPPPHSRRSKRRRSRFPASRTPSSRARAASRPASIAALNTGIGSNDAREAVLENRARAARHLGTTPERLATPYQVHGTDAVIVEEVWGPGLGPKADAVVTEPAGHRRRRRRGGLRAGALRRCRGARRGRRACRLEGRARRHPGIDDRRDGERSARRAKNIVAVLGPTISAAAYEVGPEFVARFVEADAGNARFFRPSERAGHSHVRPARPTSSRGSKRRASASAQRRSASAPIPTRRASSPTAARRIAASRTTAGCSRRSC